MSISIKMIADFLHKQGIENHIEGDLDVQISGFSSLFSYKPGTVTFVVPERQVATYLSNIDQHNIALIIMSYDEVKYERFQSIIRVKDPHKVFFLVIEHYFDANIDESVTGISSNPEIYRRHSYISGGAIIGKNVKIGVGCVIESNVVIGENTEIHHNVVIRNRTKIGTNCTIFSGTIIGERGFNLVRYEDGTKHMIKHYGGVAIEDDVHIGDNCCIIQGAIDDTVIKRGVKINTMVHIAHNVVIGENTVITAPTHICGSVNIGKNCHVAACIIRNQVSVEESAVLGLGAVVVKDVEAGDTVVGNPAKSMKND